MVLASFRRPLTQVGLGVTAGGGVVATSLLLARRGAVSAEGAAGFLGYAALVLAVCLRACIVPTRRALRVEPTEVLRADG